MRKILITGASGFIGGHLARYFNNADETDGNKDEVQLILPIRHSNAELEALTNAKVINVGDIDGNTDWDTLLKEDLHGVDTVIHCAGNAEALKTGQSFSDINVKGTVQLAKAALKAGIPHFIFLSSVKATAPVDENDAYGQSKAQAEQELKRLFAQSSLTQTEPVASPKFAPVLTILRPCMVYGPGGKGTFMSLTNALKKQWPMPLGAIRHNRRSLLYIDNLISLISHLCNQPTSGTFVVSNGDTISTTQMVNTIKAGVKSKSLNVPVPASVFKLVGRITGKTAITDRLIGDMAFDIANTIQQTGWQPNINTQDSILYFLSQNHD